MLQNTPDGLLATSWHFTLGLGNLLNEGIRSYIQVSYDFIQDSIRKLVLTGPPSPFPLFLIPYLMDTPRVWYRWKGIFKDYLGVSVTWRTDHFPRATSALPGHRLLHILSIYLHFLRDHPHLDLSPLPLFKFYDSSTSILRVLEVVLR